jgi:sec-independent protein translocase protein TatC
MALVSFPGTPSPYAPEPEEEEDDGSAKMSFLDHLEELRRRLIVSIIAVTVGFVVAYGFVDRIYAFIMAPLTKVIPGGKFIYTEPAEAFMLQLKGAALVGLILALPVVMWQAWKFIAPGLYTNEKKFAIPFVVFSTVFFVCGVAFAHYMVFPWAWVFFGSFSNDDLQFMPSIQPVFGMYTRLLLAMGLVFEMPTVVFFLARIGLVTAGMMLRLFKYAILVIFIVAAVLTPGPDVASQCLMAGPMIGLYVVSIGIAWAFQRKRTPE